ncbi:MAG: hypothetical protein ACKVQT_19635 [Burkholderiales bacterium]
MAAAVAGCTPIDQARFSGLSEAFDALHTRAADSHKRVQRLQEAVYRAKVSLAPKLDEESLARPEWLETSKQFHSREENFDAVREFVSDLKALSGLTPVERINVASRKLFDGADTATNVAKEVAKTVAVLEPRQPGITDLMNKLFPNASIVGAAMAQPVLERARSKDLRDVMRAGRPLVRAKLEALLPSNEVLAEYVMGLKTEYLPDAATLRDQLSGGDRHRFDQAALDLLAEFDATATQVASLSKGIKLFNVAYDDAALALDGMAVSGDSLRQLLRESRAGGR